jgi:hypothetical protein
VENTSTETWDECSELRLCFGKGCGNKGMPLGAMKPGERCVLKIDLPDISKEGVTHWCLTQKDGVVFGPLLTAVVL